MTTAAPTPCVLRLYITSASPRSTRAVVNLRRLLDHHLPDRYALEVLDIAGNVEQARADQIVAAPTLLRLAPLPVRRVIGDLSDTGKVLAGLEIPDVGVQGAARA